MSLLFLKSFLLLMSSPFVLVRYSKKQKYQLNIPTFSTSISHRCRKEPLSKYVWVPERQNYMTESLFQPSLFFDKIMMNTVVKFKSRKKRCTLKCYFKCIKRLRRNEEMPYLMQKTQKTLKKSVTF